MPLTQRRSRQRKRKRETWRGKDPRVGWGEGWGYIRVRDVRLCASTCRFVRPRRESSEARLALLVVTCSSISGPPSRPGCRQSRELLFFRIGRSERKKETETCLRQSLGRIVWEIVKGGALALSERSSSISSYSSELCHVQTSLSFYVTTTLYNYCT